MKNQRALVIGGGIAGPALAILLQRAGFAVRVFESHPRSDEVGGSFQVAPNGMRVLAELGLADALFAEGTPSRAFTFRNHRGQIIGRTRTDKSGPALNIGRPALQRRVRDQLERCGMAVAYGQKLVALDQSDDGVVARFADGSRAEGDFLVGADGIWSRVRGALLPDEAAPRDTGLVSIGGFCQPSWAPPAEVAPENELHFMVGPRHQLGYGRFGAQWAWWAHMRAESPAEEAALTTRTPAALTSMMAARYAGWSTPVAELLAHTAHVLPTHICDVPRLSTWHRGSVGLIGDAAHAMSSAGGQGVSMALSDARALAQLLTRTATPQEAFAQLQTQRKRRAEAFVRQAYANDRRTLQHSGPVGLWLRDHVVMPLLVPLVIGRGLERHYAAPLDA